MARIVYQIAPDGDQWSVTRDGNRGMSHVTQEAAFEVVVGEAGEIARGEVLAPVLPAHRPVKPLFAESTGTLGVVVGECPPPGSSSSCSPGLRIGKDNDPRRARTQP